MVLTNEYQYIGRTSGVKAFSSYWYYYILLYAKTNGSEATGKHTVSVKMKLVCDVDSTFSGYKTTGSATVDGISAISWTSQANPNTDWKNSDSVTAGGVTYPRGIDLAEGSVEVDVGYGVTKDVTLYTSWQRLVISGDPPSFVPKTNQIAGSFTVTLPMLNGAATITNASAVTLGNACSVMWTPLTTSSRYRLEFSLGDWSYTTELLHPNTLSSYTYTGYKIPLEVANHITDNPTGTMTATLRTYSDSEGAVLVGEDTEEFTVTVPDNEDTKPAVGMELSLVSDLPYPFDSMYIQNLTKVSADISAEGQYGADIALTQLVIGGVSYGDPYVSGYLTQTGDVTVTGKATDSRGYVGKAEQTITVIPYGKPAIVPADGESDIVCVRCDQSGNITDSGTWLKIKAKRSYSQVIYDGVQYNTCAFRYRVNGGAWVPIPADGDELDTKLSGVVTSTTRAYSIDIGVVDDLGYDAFVSFIVPSDQVEFHLREGGDGAAFGEYAQEAKVLAVAESWELRVKGRLTVGGAEPIVKDQLLELIYPVGSIYMSVNAVSPATFLGGTWERIEDRFLLAAGSKYSAGNIGGEAEHTLTADESGLPKHSHGASYSGADFYIRHGLNANTDSVAEGTNTSIEKAVGTTWATGFSTSSYSHKLDKVNIAGTVSVRDNEAKDAAKSHNNMPPYLAVYIWKRTA